MVYSIELEASEFDHLPIFWTPDHNNSEVNLKGSDLKIPDCMRMDVGRWFKVIARIQLENRFNT